MAKYRIEFLEGHGLRGEPEPLRFWARDDEIALTKAGVFLGIKLPLSVRKLHDAGAKGVFRGTRQVFPPKKKK